MRFALAFLIALFATAAIAQERYDNARFGYSIDMPAGFFGQGESDNGDGQVFATRGKPIHLAVWGGNLLNDFESEVAQRMAWDASDAWNITYQATTPRWASYSALKGSRILYQRMVLLCDGTSYAAFRAEYSVTNASEMDTAVEKLVQSLRGTC